MFSLLLIVLYTICSILFLVKYTKNYRNHLSAKQVTITFIIKVLFGMAYGFIFYKFYNGDDTWKYHQASLEEYQKLLHYPLNFLQDTFTMAKGKTGLEAVYDTRNSFWNNIDEVLFVKMLAVFNIASFGHYYVNVVLFCFLAYFGNLYLLRLFLRYFPQASPILIIVIFYFPMVVFWLSGLRKDGLLLAGLSLVLFYFDRLVSNGRKSWKDLFPLIAGLSVLWFIRNLMIMCLAPALLAWFLCYRIRWQPVRIFAGVYIVSISLFFLSGRLAGFPNLAQKVANRQYDFFNLVAKTRLPLDSLKAAPASYLYILPQAVNHTFFRPTVFESKSILQIAAAFDVIAFWAVLCLAIIFYNKQLNPVFKNPVVLTCLFTSFCGYLLIGYTVPFPGAIVRYKVIFELLFLCVFVLLTNQNKFKRLGIK